MNFYDELRKNTNLLEPSFTIPRAERKEIPSSAYSFTCQDCGASNKVDETEIPLTGKNFSIKCRQCDKPQLINIAEIRLTKINFRR